MKKVLLFAMVCILSSFVVVNAQDSNAEFLINEDFENYEVGDKIAEKGNDCWTTWSTEEGGAEDGVVADLNGRKCAYFKNGNDQVIKLGNYSTGSYEIEFDVYVPAGKSGYYNILHSFAGSSSIWAMQGYLNMINNSETGAQSQSAGHGTIHAGGSNVADLPCVSDAWMHFRFVIDINADLATFYCTMPDAEEEKIVEWEWRQNSFADGSEIDRHLDAMNFYPPLNTSEFYVDNFTLKQLSAAGVPEISFEQTKVDASAAADDLTSVELTIENTGTALADYTAWIDYGVGEDGNAVEIISYAAEITEESTALGLTVQEPTIIEVGAMYPASAYASSVAGTKITHVGYPFVELEEGAGYGIVEGSDVVFRVYEQGYNGQPGECLAEKTLPYSEIKNGWVAVALDNPVELTGYNVWVTVSLLQSQGGYPMLFDGATENLAPYGDVFRVGNEGSFYLASELFSKVYGNFHIMMTCAGTPVLGGWAELEKVDGTIKTGETATLTINFNTFNLEKGKTYEAKIICTVDGSEEVFEAPLSLRIWGENVEEILSNTYNIYRNPTTGMVTVEGENIDYVAVYNSVGQLVKVVKTQDNVVDMTAYENGVYFFNVVDNAGQSAVQRVVVAK